MVKVTPEFIVQVSPKPIVSLEVIVVLTVNVLETASASWINPKDTKIKILANTGIVNFAPIPKIILDEIT